MRVDSYGNLTTIGSITAQEVSTTQLTLTSDASDATNKTYGTGVVSIGSFGMVVETAAASENVLVLVTPTVVTEHLLAVTSIVPGAGFVVELPLEAGTNITFNWWIISRK